MTVIRCRRSVIVSGMSPCRACTVTAHASGTSCGPLASSNRPVSMNRSNPAGNGFTTAPTATRSVVSGLPSAPNGRSSMRRSPAGRPCAGCAGTISSFGPSGSLPRLAVCVGCNGPRCRTSTTGSSARLANPAWYTRLVTPASRCPLAFTTSAAPATTSSITPMITLTRGGHLNLARTGRPGDAPYQMWYVFQRCDVPTRRWLGSHAVGTGESGS